jgi:hypothetical protein
MSLQCHRPHPPLELSSVFSATAPTRLFSPHRWQHSARPKIQSPPERHGHGCLEAPPPLSPPPVWRHHCPSRLAQSPLVRIRSRLPQLAHHRRRLIRDFHPVYRDSRSVYHNFQPVFTIFDETGGDRFWTSYRYVKPWSREPIQLEVTVFTYQTTEVNGS